MSISKPELIPVERVEKRILLIRGHKVLLDSDLALLYGVTTKRFNEQVVRNIQRFPSDFMLQLTQEEWGSLRSQYATLKNGWGQHRKYLPRAFTEHGAIMAASILNSPLAIEVSVYVVRAFVRLRELLASNKELARRLDQHEKQLATHDQAISGLVDTLRQILASPEPPPKRRIGFIQDD
jgi:hypothetical protein